MTIHLSPLTMEYIARSHSIGVSPVMRLHRGIWCSILVGMVCRLGFAVTGLPALTTVSEIRDLSALQADRGYPVHLQGVVTFYDGPGGNIFFEDPTGPIYLHPSHLYAIVPGSRVEVWGTTSSSYTTQVEVSDIRETSRGPLPKPAPLSYSQAAQHQNDCRYA